MYKGNTILKYFILINVPHTFLTALMLLYNKDEEFRVRGVRCNNLDAFIIFQITTKGRNLDALKRTIDSLIYWLKRIRERYNFNYRIDIVVDEDIPEYSRKFFESIKKRKDVNIIFVPKNYRTFNLSKFKARALQYAVEYRRSRGEITEKYWIYHLDEESIVGEDTLLGIIEFIHNKRGVVGQGLIIYPNMLEKNVLISFFDSIRPSEDITKYKLQTLAGKILFGLHGSHLLIRSDIENEIGWDFGHVRAEDAIFGINLNIRKFKVSWLKGKLYEQSPRNFKDLVKQRARWFYGKIDILKLNVPKIYKLLVVFQIFGWLYGIFYVMIILFILISIERIPPIYLGLFSANISTLLYLYWIGFELNSKYNVKFRNDEKRFLLRMINVILVIPIIFLESLIAWYALITYKNNKDSYEIIEK